MSQKNLILLGVLALQVLLVLGMRLGGDDKAMPKSVEFLTGFDADKVTKIEILGAPKDGDGPPQNSVTLAKAGATWGIATADNFPADESKVKDFLKNLGKLRWHETVVRSPKYHDKLEVSETKYQRKVTVTQDGQETVFFVGTSPRFKNLHVRKKGEDDVRLVGELSTGDFSDRAWGWVDRNYVKYDASDVWAVGIQNEKDTFTLEKNPADDSWSVPGLTGKLKQTLVADLTRKASQISLEEPVGKEVKPEYGLGKTVVTLVTGTSTVAGMPPPSTETTTIQIGNKTGADNRYYVKSSANDYVVKVATWAVDPLMEKTKADLLEEEKKEEKK